MTNDDTQPDVHDLQNTKQSTASRFERALHQMRTVP